MELEVQGVYLFVLLLEVSKKLNLKLYKHLVLFTDLQGLQGVCLTQVMYAFYALNDALAQKFNRPDHSSADAADQNKAHEELQRREDKEEWQPELQSLFRKERPQATDSFDYLIVGKEYVVFIHAGLNLVQFLECSDL